MLEFEKTLRILRLWAALWLGVVLLGAGCGYHFSAGGNLPRDVATVYLAPLANRSKDVGIERELGPALIGEFHRRGSLRLVERLEEADAVLGGVVRSLDTSVVGVNDEAEALLFESVLVVDMTLRRRSPDEVLWSARGSRFVERYSGSRGAVVTTSSAFKQGTLNPGDMFPFTDIQLTETLSREARSKLIDRLAQEIHRRIMDRF